MLSAETMKWRAQTGKLGEFDLVFWKGIGRVVDVDADTLTLLVRGKRADYTWTRVRDTWDRLQVNHILTVDELGGQHDAVGLVSLFASLHQREVAVDEHNGVLTMRKAEGKPVRPFPGSMLPASWDVVQRKIDGD
jgi:hypothetical protein